MENRTVQHISRKKLDELVRGEYTVLNDLIRGLVSGVLMFDRAKKVIVTNPAIAKMTGLSGSGFSMSKFIELFESEGKGAENLDQRIDEVLQGKAAVYVREIHIFRFYYKIYIVPIKDRGDRIIGGAITLDDITKEKEVEKLRVDFLTLASHQLRTPLSGTKWLIETLQRGVLGAVAPKQKEYLDEIYNVNERMLKLVSDMLNALWFESGAAAMNREVVSISDLCAEVSFMMASAAKKRGIILRNLLDDNREGTVMVDVLLLRSVLECFVSNAINYSNPGQEVIFDAKEETAAVVFFVKDSGIGIPKEEQKRIFERFYRASNAKIMKPDGTGLGLYIAAMLAEKIGAKISFESEVENGSIFYLRVPK